MYFTGDNQCFQKMDFVFLLTRRNLHSLPLTQTNKARAAPSLLKNTSEDWALNAQQSPRFHASNLSGRLVASVLFCLPLVTRQHEHLC
jgi:hypothetical protein